VPRGALALLDLGCHGQTVRKPFRQAMDLRKRVTGSVSSNCTGLFYAREQGRHSEPLISRGITAIVVPMETLNNGTRLRDTPASFRDHLHQDLWTQEIGTRG